MVSQNLLLQKQHQQPRLPLLAAVTMISTYLSHQSKRKKTNYQMKEGEETQPFSDTLKMQSYVTKM